MFDGTGPWADWVGDAPTAWAKANEAAALLVERMAEASREENRAAGARLVAVSDLDLVRLRQYGECETWASNTQESICAEIAAALRIGRSQAEGYLHHARAMRMRLPKVGRLLRNGDISYAMFQTVVYRTDLVTDSEILARIDTCVAARVSRWTTFTRSGLGSYVDKVVAQADADAVRQRREKQSGREFGIHDVGDGLSDVFGRLFVTDAHAVDARLDALADTVCDADPRTRAQRRADAMGAMAVGADRLACRCGLSECPAGNKPVPSPVLIHVIAEQASIDGTGSAPGSLVGADALIPAEVLATLADYALHRSLIHPGVTPPEPGYAPSAGLADFVSCRDLTCRFPGCDEPVMNCDLDHTVPYADGGPTHAANLKALCRRHHLIKTFWGWKDQQLPDGTVIWTAPDGHTYVTLPGSALLFPTLNVPVGQLNPRKSEVVGRRADRTLAMPKRRRTRAQNRAAYIAAERRRNRQIRQAREATHTGAAPPDPDDEPPPF